LFVKLFSSQLLKFIFSQEYVILQIGVTSAAVHTKNASEKLLNSVGRIFVSSQSIFNFSFASCIIVALVIQGKIVPGAGVYNLLSFIKNIFSPGPSAI
jgi:hypothetical protein